MSRVPGGHNDKLDLFKCIGIYGVVLAHVPLPGQFGMAVCALAKFSVVLFFLTAGYFSYDRSSAVLRRRTLKTGWLLLGAAALLVVLGYAMESRQGVTLLLAPVVSGLPAHRVRDLVGHDRGGGAAGEEAAL